MSWLKISIAVLGAVSLIGCSSQPTMSEIEAAFFSKAEEVGASAASATEVKSQTVAAVVSEVSPKPVAATVKAESIGRQNTAFDPVSEAVATMVVQLAHGLNNNRIQRFPMAISPFVNLERATERYSGRVGERLAESFIFQMQQGGFNMLDYRAVSLLTTLKDPITRQNMSTLRNRNRVYFLLTGTYSRYPDGIVVNARVLDTTTRQVVASAQTHIPDERLEGALPGYNPLVALEKGMIIENSLGPIGFDQ